MLLLHSQKIVAISNAIMSGNAQMTCHYKVTDYKILIILCVNACCLGYEDRESSGYCHSFSIESIHIMYTGTCI